MATRMKDYHRHRTCTLCFNTFDKPKILECFHSFCENCLEDYITKEGDDDDFKCPTCKKLIKIPEAGVKGFTSNFYIEDIEDFKERALCDVCDGGFDPAEYSCKDCQHMLCAACKTTHASHTSCVGLEVNSLKGDGQGLYNIAVCPQHNKTYAEFCLDCQLVICSRCTKQKHERHTIMNVNEIGDISNDARLELEAIKEKWEKKRDCLRDFQTAVQRESFKLNSQTTEACNQVDMHVDEACKNMKKQGERIKFEIRNCCGAGNLLLNQTHDDVTDLIHDLDLSNGKLANHLTSCDDLELLNVLPRFKYKLETIDNKRHIIPDINFPKFERVAVDTSFIIGVIENNKRKTFQHSFDVQQFKKHRQMKSPAFMVFDIPVAVSVRENNPTKESMAKSFDVILDKFDHLWYKPWISFEIINKQASQTLRTPFQNSLTWSNVMAVSKLSDVQNGFIDRNNTFTVRVTFK